MNYKRYSRTLRHIASFPFIWFMIIPIALMDVCVEVYHRVCFPLYGIKPVKRKEYIRFDRHRLEYLSLFDKINCTYCAYANGLAAYIVAIAGRTEQYWCGIKHQSGHGYREPEHHKSFMEYGDAKEYEEKVCKLEKRK